MWHVWGTGESTYRVLLGRPQETSPFGSSRRIWEDSMEKDLQEVGCGGMDWIDLARDRDRWQGFRVPYDAGNFLTS